MAQPSRVQLNDGRSIPQLGFGVWLVPPESTEQVVAEALRTGFRAIDTAEGYGNEQGVGTAIRHSDIDRSEIYVTSKLRNGAHAYDEALKAFDRTMAALDLDVLDLFLIHWPVPAQDKYVEAWRALIQLQNDGRVRSIGVSNFNTEHLERIIGETGVVPVINQVELHPRYQQRALRAFHARHDIRTESYSPLGHGKDISNPIIGKIAEKHARTPAQVIIRWHLQQDLIAIPKSVTPERIRENFAALDFELDQEDMRQIERLDDPQGRISGNPATSNDLF
ncbi:MAG TPA: aldo/keto reductase [Devosia sp.]|nr:aldo/keto reductase [Devosia sp.]